MNDVRHDVTDGKARVRGLIRTVLGDIAPQDLGVCLAHEHLIIDGGIPKIINPDLALQSVDAAAQELEPCKVAGVQSLVDAMPADAGRNVAKLVELSRRTELNIIACTGLHHERYYGERHWGALLEPEEMAQLFIQEIMDGIDFLDLCGPVVRRSPYRAGCVKVAGSAGGPSDRDRRVFQAAVEAAQFTGVPLMTHCEGGTGGLEQLELLRDLGMSLGRVILSHTDKVADYGYHHEMLASGVNLVYDQGLRTPGQTLALLDKVIADGQVNQVLLGTDAARRSLWTVFGGTPGIAAIRRSFGAAIEERFGEHVARSLWIENPARVFTME